MRILVKSVLPVRLWRIVFCRAIYEKSIQKYLIFKIFMLFLFIIYCWYICFCLVERVILCYNDQTLEIMMMVNLWSSCYIAISSINIETIIVVLFIILFIPLISIHYLCKLLCNKWYSEVCQANTQLDREYILSITTGNWRSNLIQNCKFIFFKLQFLSLFKNIDLFKVFNRDF